MFHETSSLSVLAPFRLDYTVWALRRRQKNLIDRWDGIQYHRIVVFDNNPVQLTVTRGRGKRGNLVLTLHSKKGITAQVHKQARALVRQMLGVTVNLEPFYALAGKHGILGTLAAEFAGVKPPRFPDVWEALVNAIACQQVTLDLGILLLNRLSERYGPVFVDGGERYYAFPRPVDLASVSEAEVKQLGFSYQKARALKELAIQITERSLDLAALAKMNNNDALAKLLSLRGVGRWTAEYALLRGLGRLDIFPGDDVGAQNNLQRLFGLAAKPDYGKIGSLTAPWNPYQGLVYFHLLLEKLRQKGVVPAHVES